MNQIIVSAARASTPFIKEMAKEGVATAVQCIVIYSVMAAAAGTAFVSYKGCQMGFKAARKGFNAARTKLAATIDPDTDEAAPVSKAA